MSLTDRLANALRDVMSKGSEADLDGAFRLLAEYDDSRAAPVRSAKIVTGSRVRTTRASRKTRDYQLGDEAVVVRGDAIRGGYVVHWLTDLGDNMCSNRSTFLRTQDCEVIS